MLTEDLQKHRQRFLSIQDDAHRLLDDLTDAQFNWRPSPTQWSIGHCIDHLVVTGRSSLWHINQAITEARSRRLLSQGPFRYRLVDKWFVSQMEPGARMKFKAPKAYLPSQDVLVSEIALSFFRLQEDFLESIEQANGIDLSRAKVNNQVTRWFRLSLGQEFAFNVAHERRHLLQSERLKMMPGFRTGG